MLMLYNIDPASSVYAASILLADPGRRTSLCDNMVCRHAFTATTIEGQDVFGRLPKHISLGYVYLEDDYVREAAPRNVLIERRPSMFGLGEVSRQD